MAKTKINPEIEYLRAVAILMVLFDHLPALLHWGPMIPPSFGADQEVVSLFRYFAGWSGVDLFFCISGYVISLSFIQFFDHKKMAGDPWRTIKAFWVRRFFRLIPSAWLWLGVMILCSIFLNRSGAFMSLQDNLQGALAVITYTANFVSLHHGMMPNGIYWSLTLEEQFYFIFPLFLMLFSTPARWIIFLALIVLQALPDRSDFDTLLWVTRTDALLWGCLMYQFSQTMLYRQIEPYLFRRPWLVAATGVGLILMLGMMAAHPARTRPISLIAIDSAILVLLASYQRGSLMKIWGPFKNILLWIGSRSYAIYLIHIPVFYITYEIWFRVAGHELSHDDCAILLVIAAPTLCFLTEINFRLIETPFRRMGTTIARRMLS